MIRRLIASGAAIGLLLSAVAPVAAHGRDSNEDGYVVNVLVSTTTDPDLVNGWGLSRGPTTPWWVADNGTDRSTLYNASGVKQGLVVAIPGGAPTGTVFNINSATAAAPFHGDRFLFASEAGIISGWRPALGTTAEIGADESAAGAVYKGLAIGTSSGADYLYATDFHDARVDVFDSSFGLQAWSGAFVDPRLPKHYAPFGIQNLNGMIFVTYALQQPGSNDELAGRGRGIVDAYASDGTFLARVASHGSLNAPWGLAWAPADFGRFSGDLIVGNFGNGRLNAFRWDGHRWHPDGKLRGSNEQPVVIDGLWAIAFGGGAPNNGPTNTLFFAAGPNDEAGGAFGTISLAP
jgi:uncharacterized protein (TIGR03118 family)